MNKLLSVLTIFLFLNCVTDEYEAEKETLFSAKVKWKSAKESNADSYSFKSHLGCFCAYTGDYRITLDTNAITSVQELTTGKFLTEKEFQYFRTIDQWFDYIYQSLKREPDNCSITYDQTYGYPTEIIFDFDKRMIDDELFQKNDSLQFSTK